MNSQEEIRERLLLCVYRVGEIKDEMSKCKSNVITDDFKRYFIDISRFITMCYEILMTYEDYIYDNYSIEDLKTINYNLYSEILPENYGKSFANPDVAVDAFGKDYGRLLSFLYAEIRTLIAYAYEKRELEFTATVELFLEIYSMFSSCEEMLPQAKYIKEAVCYHMFDYADVLVADRVRETLDPSYTFATDIVMKSDLSDVRYLYKYGEYIGDNELKTAEFLNKLPEEDIKAMAKTYVDGFVKGFETMRIDLKPKKSVNIRYSIGQERMVREAIKLFEEQGLKPVIFRYAVSRCNRKLTVRTGYMGTPANKQYEYDHRMDEALFFNKAYVERKLSVIEDTYEKYKDMAAVYAGPAVIETFGELPFKPEIKENVIKLSKKQQEMSVSYAGRNAAITNKYIPRDKYSFTIIAYPIPEIGEDFEEIFAEIVKVNTLDNELYKNIQQSIIDELDKAEYMQVLGKGENKTDIKVMLHKLGNPEKETNFENCLADVNIPVGEVFTSPVLTGTNGVLNVSQVYLNELKYVNLNIMFKDGKIADYTCDNFDSEEENKKFIKENLMFNHETLPIGEFAIGTNTTAYVMAKKRDIVYKLPILIVEKMGPHFAVGDTCYSYSEEAVLYNPDGKEIIAKENECSLLRKSQDEKEQEKAYFNCHTDITIPYEEIGAIYSVHPDGARVAIIKDGRFVLEGTEELNRAFED